MEGHDPTIGPLAPAQDEVETNGEVSDDGLDTILDSLHQEQADIQPFGKTKILEVPGYKGMLGIEYNYISTEVTEAIAREVNRETKHVNGEGNSILSSMETLIRACRRVLVRDNPSAEWKSIAGQDRPDIKLTEALAQRMRFDAGGGSPREVIMALFGSDHAIINQNLIFSRWLADTKRTTDEDFLA